MNDVITEFESVKDGTNAVKLNAFIEDDVLVVSMTGELNTYNSDFFQKRVAVLEKLNMKNYVFNLGALTYVSSTGIGSFIQILNSLKRKIPPAEMVLCGIKPKIYEVFQLLGFSTFFNKFDNVDSALQHFKVDEKPTFPAILACPSCSHKLKAMKSGKFRCPRCKTIVVIDSEGKIFKE
mgnify:CR=1 FL=1